MVEINSDSKISSLQYGNQIAFVPKNLIKEYMVKLVVNKGAEKENVLLYRVKTTWNKLEPSGFLVKVETRDFLVNYENPSSMIEILAEECRNSLKTIVVQLDNFGKLQQLLNFQEIVAFWNQIKENLALKYSGDIVEKYIKLQNEALSSEETVLYRLKNDLFLNHYFYPIYNNAFHDFKLELIEKSNLLQVKYTFPIDFLAQNNAALNDKEQIEFEKKINSKYDNQQMPVSSYETKYTLNRDHSIESISGNFEALGQKLTFSIYAVPDTKAFDT